MLDPLIVGRTQAYMIIYLSNQVYSTEGKQQLFSLLHEELH